MKKVIITLLIVANVVVAQEKQGQSPKVFDKGLHTSVCGINSLFSYFRQDGKHVFNSQFPETRVVEFDGKDYRAYGSLRQVRAPFLLSDLNYDEQIKLDRNRSKFIDFVRCNQAVHCPNSVEFFTRDGEYGKTGAIILGTQNTSHCAQLEELLHKQFCENIKEKVLNKEETGIQKK